jgi:hypothetical protein
VRRILLLVSLCATWGCKSSDPQPEPEPMPGSTPEAAPVDPAPSDAVTTRVANETKPCQRTLCIAGPGEPTSEPNIDLAELCRQMPGVVRRCEGETCRSAWQTEDWRAGLDGLITSLDLDASGKVDAGDPLCTINVAGWSTGAAILAGPMIEALASDPRMAPERAIIERMVLVAPWQSGAGPTFAIPESVRNAWIYRNSVAPTHDCSRAWDGGPWISPKPECGPQTTCWDYDYSFEPQLAFVSRRGARSGAEIGHCNMMAAVAKVAPDNLARGTEALAEHMPRFSDGRPAGRPHDRHDRR